jgi:phospholipid/cholesterol/gamma-HCH transport system permease protein
MTRASDAVAASENVTVAPSEHKNIFAELATLVSWIGRTIAELPQSLRYPDEIIRQLAKAWTSSCFVVWGMGLTSGFIVGEVGHYLLQQIGAQAYIGLFSAAGTLKATTPVFFGFMVAAKIGCGYVAELGSMRINEETDAMEVMGVSSLPYLVGTRVWAAIIAMPVLFITSLSCAFIGNYVTNVLIYHTASAGGYNYVFWAFTTSADLFLRSMFWAVVPSIAAVIIACYYGYNAQGGPVGVGEATARSMMINIVMVNVFGAGIMFELFYGTSIIVPIGN